MIERRIYTLIYTFFYVMFLMVVVGSFLRENWLVFFLALITMGAIVFLRFIFKHSRIVYPRGIEITLVVFLAFSFIVDDFLIQTQTPLLSFVINIFSGALFSVFAFVLVYALNRFHKMSLNLKPLFVVLFSFTFSLSLNFLWLFCEYLIVHFTLIQKEIIQPENVIWSVFGMLSGAIIICAAGYQYLTKGSLNIVGSVLNDFFMKNPAHRPQLQNLTEDSLHIIRSGENDGVEFKQTLRTNLHTGKKDQQIERAILKTISAFLNAGGGILFVGVNDRGHIVGLKQDHFANIDKFQLHFINIVKQHLGQEALQYIEVRCINTEDGTIFRVDCFSSDVPIFVLFDGQEEFFVRTGAASQILQGKSLITYITKRY